MTTRQLKIVAEGKAGEALTARPRTADEPLSRWLEAQGHPLNTRCGGRGLCRGCTVTLRAADGGSRDIRSCQHRLAGLAPEVSEIRIPRTSVRDQSLHGVSTFEIRTEIPDTARRATGTGLALDIGTTTVAAALWDLDAARCLAAGSRANAQARFGDNVLARIQYSLDEPDGIRHLQRALVRESLNPLVEALTRQAGIQPDAIGSGTAAGNTAMLHTLAGEPLAGLSRYPFKPGFLDTRILPAAGLGLAGDFAVTLLPGLGAFVGADIAAGAVAAGIAGAEPPVLLIDFGTNGEILLKHPEGYLAAATAAGPAFEGGRLSCGAPAREHVVSALFLDERQRWSWRLSRGGEGRPVGISGAAYVDFLALGIEAGLLNAFGRFVPGVSGPGELRGLDGGERRCYLDDRLSISEADIAELMQAKAAIGGGVATLLQACCLRAEDLKTVFVAGGFGYHLDPRHAIATGLLPAVPAGRVEIIGNASLGGASLLLQAPGLPLLARIREHARTVELNQLPSFEDNFTDALTLEPQDC